MSLLSPILIKKRGIMKTLLRLPALIVAMLFLGTGLAIAGGAGTFYVNTEAYHGPIYVSPDGSVLASCHNNGNWRVYESDHFLVYCDQSSDANCSKYSGMAETEFASVKATLGVTDGELGINTTEPSTKRHICSDWNGSGASGDSSGITMPALDESNVKVDPLDRLHDFAGYRDTIRHEMTHLFQGILAADNLNGTKLELWFTEGLAVFIANHRTIMDTLALADYYAAGRPNPLSVVTRDNMPGLSNSDIYPAFGVAVKYLFDSTARGGAGNSMSRIKEILNGLRGGKSFSVAFGENFTKSGASLTLAGYRTNFQSWINAYLSNLETPGTVTGISAIGMVGVFPRNTGCDMISGFGTVVTPSGTFTLNVSELADGFYGNALCFMSGDGNTVYGPGGFTVSAGRLSPTSYNIVLWPENCTYALSLSSYGMTSSGGAGNVTITPSSGSCGWAAVSNDSWITIVSDSSGTGTGTVTYNVTANGGAARTGTLMIGGQTFTVTQEPGTAPVIPLSAGWNFIAFPNLPTIATIATVFADVSSNTRIIWGYDNSIKVWKKYKPGSPDNSLSTIERGKGYWVYMDASGNINISGWDAQPKTVPLFEGWNLIGYSGIDGSLSVPTNYVVGWTWENGQWYAKHSNSSLILPVPPINSLKKGKAYWIKMYRNVNWEQ
jgi:hypothetical protein